MKKDVTVHLHLDNLVEIKDFIQSDFDDSKTYYIYPIFWYDHDSDRAYCSLCFTEHLKDYNNSTTIFPPDVDLAVDLYIQFGRIMELVKECLPIFFIQPLEYRES